MKKLQFTLIVICTVAFTAFSQISALQMNSLGYLPTAEKVVNCSLKFQFFQVINAETDNIIFEGNAEGPMSQSDLGIDVWTANFTNIKETGKYKIQLDNGIISGPFIIAKDVYDFAFNTSMRGFYLWRCGTAVSGDFKGDHFEHEACHLNDAYLDYIGQPGEKKDGTGGWHDAGDYGKYVVNAGVSVGMLFMAWDHFNDKLKNVNLDLPETAKGYPEFLEELKWETDWLLKMAYPDGSGRISHKLTRTNFSAFIMPKDDQEKRYFTEWGSAATADFVAIMAQAARYFKPFDETYAQQCLDAAVLSYKYLSDHLEYKRFEQGDFKTGGYQTTDKDDRLWAAAELWETTGEINYLNDVEGKILAMGIEIDSNWDWGDVSNMGLFTYVLSDRKGKNKSLESNIKKEVVKTAMEISGMSHLDVFNRPLGDIYYWGCNGTVARQVVNLQVANILEPNPIFVKTSLNAIHHLFGRNYYARSFVTGLGSLSPMHPHDRRSAADGVDAPWPGYLVGGGQTSTDWVDDEGSYTTNEIAINWQAALVYALAGFIE